MYHLINKYRKVASSRPVYYSIFEHFWGATKVRCATNRGLLYERATIQFLNFFGVLLTKSCYKQRRAPAPDFTVGKNFWFTKVTWDTYIKVGIKFIQDLFRFEIIPAVFSIHLLYQVLFSFEKRFKAPNIIQTLFKRWQHGSKRNF